MKHITPLRVAPATRAPLLVDDDARDVRARDRLARRRLGTRVDARERRAFASREGDETR